MARQTVQEVANKISHHEAICAERWNETLSRIKRLENLMIASAGSTIILLVTLLIK